MYKIIMKIIMLLGALVMVGIWSEGSLNAVKFTLSTLVCAMFFAFVGLVACDE